MTSLGHDTAMLTVAQGVAKLSPTVAAWRADISSATHVKLSGSLPVELLEKTFALISNDGHTLRLECPPSLHSGRPVGCQVEFMRRAGD